MADQFDDQHIQATISKLLSEVARHLALFLEKVLPSLFEDWWKQAVLNSLAFQQRRRMEQRNIRTPDIGTHFCVTWACSLTP